MAAIFKKSLKAIASSRGLFTAKRRLQINNPSAAIIFLQWDVSKLFYTVRIFSDIGNIVSELKTRKTHGEINLKYIRNN